MSKRILFVSHNASRSGAPILLLRLLRWLKTNTDYQLDILVLHGGPLEAELYKAATSVQFTKALRRVHASGTAGAKLGARLHLPGLGRELAKFAAPSALPSLRRANDGNGYGLVYANTAAVGFALPLLKRFDCPVVSHIHELEYALGQLKESWRLSRENTDHYVAVSRAVQRNLVDNHGVAPGVIDVVYGFIEPSNIDLNREAARRRVRRELGLAPDTFLVGGSGTIEQRKGTDLFVQVAIAAIAAEKTVGRNMAFVWIGGNQESEIGRELTKRIGKLELESRILFVSEKPDPGEYFAALDLFALTSREDPFPLVCLEAGAQGVPTICFEGCGGIPELLEHGGGSVVARLDTTAMAAEIRRYASDPELLARESEAARRNVMEHHTVDVVAPQIAAIIDRLADHTP